MQLLAAPCQFLAWSGSLEKEVPTCSIGLLILQKKVQISGREAIMSDRVHGRGAAKI